MPPGGGHAWSMISHVVRIGAVEDLRHASLACQGGKLVVEVILAVEAPIGGVSPKRIDLELTALNRHVLDAQGCSLGARLGQLLSRQTLTA